MYNHTVHLGLIAHDLLPENVVHMVLEILLAEVGERGLVGVLDLSEAERRGEDLHAAPQLFGCSGWRHALARFGAILRHHPLQLHLLR